MCGGTTTSNIQTPWAIGLSPRVRGNPVHFPRCRAMQRSIPACAGEPGPTSGQTSISWVYPRVCGGTSDMGTGGSGIHGLSPRVRGNPPPPPGRGGGRGSIPACAGEPAPSHQGSDTHTVYPRVCGGTADMVSQSYHLKGLSPRVRGNPPNIKRRPRWSRSIPACAGEPDIPIASASTCQVYPRVCGGTTIPWGCVWQYQGLSPRVRGNHQSPLLLGQSPRSIPACAGEPSNRAIQGYVIEVYPRVCGGTFLG